MFLSSLTRKAQHSRAIVDVLRKHAPAARRDTGKPILSQAREIIALARGVGRLDPDEYYQYRLYDDRRFTWEQKTQFLGRRLENELIPVLNETWWLGLANDKLISYAFLRGLGYPVPEPYAVFHGWREGGHVPALRTRAALADFIRTINRPFVAKPVYGMWGRNISAVMSYEADRDAVRLTSGEEVDLAAFVERLDRIPDRGGILLQELLEPHPAIREQCGQRICSIRMVTIVDRRGPRLLATVWKVATGRAMADNYWEPGNLVGPIDPETGTVGRTFTGLGREIRDVERHPDTGRTLPGFTLPDWRAAVDLCLSATSAIPRLPMQAWDVALTSRGPVLLEVNVNGGMRLPQLCANAGLYRGEFVDFLARFGFPRPLKEKKRGTPRVEHRHAHGHH
jgi:glutathione synthase/RimK-type ligase-like ATP-grasp enzyme